MVAVKDSPFPPKYTIQLGGRERSLSYPILSVMALEDLTGFSFINENGANEEERKLAVEQFVGRTKKERLTRAIDFLWAGLIADEPELTRAEVANMVSFRNLEEVSVKTAAAFAAWMPEADIKDDEDPADPQQGTADPQS